MSILIDDLGFRRESAPNHGAAHTISPDADLAEVAKTMATTPLIRIHFASFSDGRGFTVAQQLRRLGYTGRLRAYGHIIADQYAMARRSGFDEIEISDELASRQPQEHWQFRADWQAHDYQSRLRGV